MKGKIFWTGVLFALGLSGACGQTDGGATECPDGYDCVPCPEGHSCYPDDRADAGQTDGKDQADAFADTDDTSVDDNREGDAIANTADSSVSDSATRDTSGDDSSATDTSEADTTSRPDSDSSCPDLPDPPGDTIVNLGDEGLSDGDEIDPYLEEHLADGTEVHIPEGTYEWNGGGDGSFDDASIVGDGEVVWNAGDGYSFGTSWSTGTAFEMRNITVTGVASEENDKFRFSATEPDAVMTVRNFHLPDGSEGGRRVGIRVNEDHAGEIWFYDLRMHNFANNALYADNPGSDEGAGGAVHLRGGYFKNNNISAVRIGSDDSSVVGTVIVNDAKSPDNGMGDYYQRGIRIRELGHDIRIEDVDILQTVSGAPIEIHDGAGPSSGTIDDVRIQNGTSTDPINIKTSEADWSGSDIHITGDGELTPDDEGDFDTCEGEGCDPVDLEPRPTCR